MSQKQIQSSDSTCISSSEQQQQQQQETFKRSKNKSSTNPPHKKKSHSSNQEMKIKLKTTRSTTPIQPRTNKKKHSKKGKRVHFKGNGNIQEMVEIVNVDSYKEYNLDLANSDYHHDEDKTKTTCSCQIY